MSDNMVDQAPTEANETLDRKELLAQQFEEAEAKAETGRDESGRFAKTTVREEEPAPEPAEEPVWKRPPLSWKKDYHEVWQKADPRLQEYAYQREEQMRRGVEPLLQAKQFADAVQEAISPYMTTLNGLGMKPEQAISALMKADTRFVPLTRRPDCNISCSWRTNTASTSKVCRRVSSKWSIRPYLRLKMNSLTCVAKS